MAEKMQSNLTRYAAGRNIDDIIDAAERGEAPPKHAATPHPEAHPAKNEHDQHRSLSDRFKDFFGKHSEAEPQAGSTQVAALESGLQVTRDALGAEAGHLSNEQIRDTLGADIVAQIGEKGFPHQEVASIQQAFPEHGLDKMDALQTYVAAVNSQPGDTLQLMDDKGNSASLNADQVLQVAGLSREEVNQVQQAQASQEGPSAEATGAEMAMG